MNVKLYIVGILRTNCYLVWDKDSGEAMLIDPGAFSQVIVSEIAERGLKLRYITLTHGHWDHIIGVAAFKEAFPEVLIVAGAAEVDMLEDPHMNTSIAFLGRNITVTPDVLLKGGDSLKVGELTFDVIETPGHTPGGLSFYIPGCDESLLPRKRFSGTVFTGDTLFQMSIGRGDFPCADFSAHEVSIKEKLYKLPGDTLVLPGHMDSTEIEYEKKNNPFVREA